ncbi:MAG: TldD/PmbA family protein [Coriobacteriia bacterium]
MTPDQARELAARAVSLTPADEAEALVTAGVESLTRFAGNRIHQNVCEEDSRVSVRAVVGTRVGVASTNRLDDDSLLECCEAAARAASLAPDDPSFPGLPGPAPLTAPDRVSAAARAFGPAERAAAVAAIVAPSAERGLTAAGAVDVSDSVIAVANSRGVDACAPVTSAGASVLAMGASGGSGWASFSGLGPEALDAAALGEEAALTAVRSADPEDLPPGSYTVLLGPEAVADILSMLAYAGLSAKALEEGSSFMAGHLGERLFPEWVTIVDDALAPHATGLPFDFEGCPKRRVALVERGVVSGPVTDSYWAARTGRPNTGHALPAPNSFGPYPLDLAMEPGERTAAELIASVERGVWVSRFHYVNVEDPVTATLTGMTRDGTFLIEDGSPTRPLKNLRFTQSAVEALARVTGVGSERRLAGERGSASFVPALLVEGFAFTGRTS